MILFKTCARCRGDLFLEDGGLWELVCLQCGSREPIGRVLLYGGDETRAKPVAPKSGATA
jgi:translation initiation factor 2 beta subunit (eIF-2beta)/eIF-5